MKSSDPEPDARLRDLLQAVGRDAERSAPPFQRIWRRAAATPAPLPPWWRISPIGAGVAACVVAVLVFSIFRSSPVNPRLPFASDHPTFAVLDLPSESLGSFPTDVMLQDNPPLPPADIRHLVYQIDMLLRQ